MLILVRSRHRRCPHPTCHILLVLLFDLNQHLLNELGMRTVVVDRSISFDSDRATARKTVEQRSAQTSDEHALRKRKDESERTGQLT
jgi:hypothetical protein